MRARLTRAVVITITVAALWLVFATAGELLVNGVLSEASPSLMLSLAGVVLVFGALGLASLLGTRGPTQDWIRYLLAGFASFFCFQLVLGGMPDWNPVWLAASFLLCGGAGIGILRVTRAPKCQNGLVASLTTSNPRVERTHDEREDAMRECRARHPLR